MSHPARLAAWSVFGALAFVSPAAAQINMQSTPPPLVTAENERWYQAGEPLLFAGSIYYPAGAAIHFIANEMVRSGSYRGIPVYSRTTIEPYSVVFVPIAGGMMQPFERPRSGDLAGTSGSSVSALPVDLEGAISASGSGIIQAPAPPALGPALVDEFSVPFRADASNREPDDTTARSRPPAVGTSGRTASSQSAAPLPVRPGAANAIYVEFQSSRWFTSGPPIARNSQMLREIGEFHGFPVYAGDDRHPSTIYIPVARGVDALVPYSKRK